MKLGNHQSLASPSIAARRLGVLPQAARLPEAWLIPVVASLVALLYAMLP